MISIVKSSHSTEHLLFLSFLSHELRPNSYQKSLMMSLTNLVAHCHSSYSPLLSFPSPSQSLSVPHRQLPSVVIGFVCAHGGHITQVLCTMHTADIKFGSVSMPMTSWPTKPTPDPRPTTLMASVPQPLNPNVSRRKSSSVATTNCSKLY